LWRLKLTTVTKPKERKRRRRRRRRRPRLASQRWPSPCERGGLSLWV
jgi:hypothetical protein